MKLLFFSSIFFLFAFIGIKNEDWTIQPQHFLFNSKKENKSQLIVFYQTDNQRFIKETLPKIKQYCTDKNIVLLEKNATEGLPLELTSTPALIFQNEKGRSIYAARYAEFSTIENFIRTSRAFPQQLSLNSKKDVLTYQNGRMKTSTVLKITPISGTVPSNFDAIAFLKKANKAIDNSMQLFDYQEKTDLQKTDRIYYLDFHPFVDKSGKLFLSYEMYSQFSCTIPVFSKIKIPLEGTLDNAETLFAQIGKTFENEIVSQLKNATNGDAYEAISDKTPIVSWQNLGLEIPNNSEMNTVSTDFSSKKLAQQWIFKGAIDKETPMMAFHFQEPLDRYAGEVKQIKGSMQLNDNQELTKGFFEVSTSSLTMGIADFDHKIHEKYIKVGRFPKATFSFDKQQIPLTFGKTTDVNLVGEFTLMGKKIPLTMTTQLTPSIGSKGEQLLIAQATFSINITDDFGIKGPDGPDPAKKTMNFFLNFYLECGL